MSSYIPIASQTTSSVSTITFSSIPTTVNGKTIRDLVLAIVAPDTDCYLVFNNDTGQNYPAVYMGVFNGQTNPYSGIRTTRTKLEIGGTAWGGITLVHILDFAQTNKHKLVLSRANSPSGLYNDATEAYAGRWASTSAITSIRLETLSGTGLQPGSIASLYGIEG